MAQFFSVHPDNPQQRLLRQAAEILAGGGVIVYPTDSCYALGCSMGDKAAIERIRRIRRFDKQHNFTLVCADLSAISTYARIDNSQYRLLRGHTPGPFTWILDASREVPKRLQHPKRRTIGIRVPDNRIVHDLLEAHGEPIMSATMILPGEEDPATDPWELRESLEHEVDLVIDGGYCGLEPTTIIDWSDGTPVLLRAGKGDASGFIDA